jgi:hypothetical protein
MWMKTAQWHGVTCVRLAMEKVRKVFVVEIVDFVDRI